MPDEVKQQSERGPIEPSVQRYGEAEHFSICPACGQTIDYRKLAQVLHHRNPGHPPLAE